MFFTCLPGKNMLIIVYVSPQEMVPYNVIFVFQANFVA